MGKEKIRAWKIRLDENDGVLIEETEPGVYDYDVFIGAICERVVGVNGSLIVSPEDPESKPWYLIKVIGCYPNLMVYDGINTAYWIREPGPAPEMRITEESVKFNKEQFDQVIRNFINA